MVLDFVSDACSDGRRFRILCVIDDFSRECLATVVDTGLLPNSSLASQVAGNSFRCIR